MTKSKLELMLCEAGLVARDQDFYLFVSKLVAWREKDQQFLRAMLMHKLVKPLIVLNRIEDLPVSPDRRSELKCQTEELVAELRASSQKFRRKQ